MHIVYIGLGSNIDPEKNMRAAAVLLRERFRNIRFSGMYKTAPREVTDQPDFLNAIAEVCTDKPVDEVYGLLKTIERTLKKRTPYAYGPRTIDLDVLLYGTSVLPDIEEWENSQRTTNNTQLLIPHPRMHERRFVLAPLCELIDPWSKHPAVNTTWKDLLKKTEDQAITKRERWSW